MLAVVDKMGISRRGSGRSVKDAAVSALLKDVPGTGRNRHDPIDVKSLPACGRGSRARRPGCAEVPALHGVSVAVGVKAQQQRTRQTDRVMRETALCRCSGKGLEPGMSPAGDTLFQDGRRELCTRAKIPDSSRGFILNPTRNRAGAISRGAPGPAQPPVQAHQPFVEGRAAPAPSQHLRSHVLVAGRRVIPHSTHSGRGRQNRYRSQPPDIRSIGSGCGRGEKPVLSSGQGGR